MTPFRREHVARVAALHCRALPGLLSTLGAAATAAFYEGYLASPRCVAFIDEENGVVRVAIADPLDTCPLGAFGALPGLR